MRRFWENRKLVKLTVLNSRQNSVCSGLKFSSESKLFGGCHPCSRATSATLILRYILTPNRMFGDSYLVPSHMVIKIGMCSYFSNFHFLSSLQAKTFLSLDISYRPTDPPNSFQVLRAAIATKCAR